MLTLPPPIGSHSLHAAKRPREMGLVRHAALEGNHRKWLLGFDHAFLGERDTTGGYISTNRNSEVASECPAEVPGAQAHEPCELPHSDWLPKTRLDVRGDFTHAPCSQPAWTACLIRMAFQDHERAIDGLARPVAGATTRGLRSPEQFVGCHFECLR